MFACLHVPDFSVQAALLSEHENARVIAKRSCVVILDGPANLPRIFALNELARAAGFRIGMTKLQAETGGAALIRKRLIADENRAQAALLECGGFFSPRVEPTGAGIAIIDLSGTEKLLGSPETAGWKILTKAEQIGLELHVGVAANPDTAFYAARGFPGVNVVPLGHEAKFLAPLPIDLLPMSSETSEILTSWGIHTFQALAALPSTALVLRLGQDGLHLQRLTRGEISRPLVPAQPASEFVESFEFDDPIESVESLAFPLSRVIQQICSRLASQCLAANELRLTLQLDVRQLRDGPQPEIYGRAWKLPVPTRDGNMLLRLARLDLEGNTFFAPIKKLTVEMVPVKPRVAQGCLFAPPTPEAERLEITLSRIRGIVGATDENGVSCVGSPNVIDSHKPESFTVEPFSSLADENGQTFSGSAVMALRIFRPALETVVQLEGEKLRSIRLWHQDRRVLAVSGPWSASGHWWNGTRWARDEWDVALTVSEGVGYYRICFDRIRKRWFVEGVFD